MQTDVAIIGGGVAGATAALALGLKGLRVTLIDLGRGHDLNRGDNLWPAALRILADLGALAALKAAGALAAGGLEFRNSQLGPLVRMDLSRLDAPYNYMLNLPHGQIVETLVAQAVATGRVELVWGQRAAGLLWADGRVAGVRLPDREVRARLVAGSDGAFSGVREWLGIAASMQPYDFSYLVLHGPRPAGYPEPLRTISQLTPVGVTVSIPLPGDRIRLAAAVPTADVQRWRALSPAAMQARLVRRQPLLAGVPLEAHGEHFYRLMQMHAEHYTAAGAVLIGDAAHVTAPFTGQGMNLAIQDAYALAEQVAGPLAAGAPLDAALRSYEQVRRAANTAVMAESHALAPLALPPTPRAFYQALAALLGVGASGRAAQGMQLARVAAGEVAGEG